MEDPSSGAPQLSPDWPPRGSSRRFIQPQIHPAADSSSHRFRLPPDFACSDGSNIGQRTVVIDDVNVTAVARSRCTQSSAGSVESPSNLRLVRFLRLIGGPNLSPWFIGGRDKMLWYGQRRKTQRWT